MKLPALKEIIEERKQEAIESLSESFAKNRLPLEEYERLVEYIQKTESDRELIVVEKIVAEFRGSEESESPAKNNNKSSRDIETDDDDDYPQEGHSSHSSNVTLLSSRKFTGPIKSGAQFVSILGTEQITIRKSDLKKHRTKLYVVSILGDSVIFVEPGIRVLYNVIPILGSADLSKSVEDQAEKGEAELIINGTALLGNISVKVIKEL